MLTGLCPRVSGLQSFVPRFILPNAAVALPPLCRLISVSFLCLLVGVALFVEVYPLVFPHRRRGLVDALI